jgi:hypothetical protein
MWGLIMISVRRAEAVRDAARRHNLGASQRLAFPAHGADSTA